MPAQCGHIAASTTHGEQRTRRHTYFCTTVPTPVPSCGHLAAAADSDAVQSYANSIGQLTCQSCVGRVARTYREDGLRQDDLPRSPARLQPFRSNGSRDASSCDVHATRPNTSQVPLCEPTYVRLHFSQEPRTHYSRSTALGRLPARRSLVRRRVSSRSPPFAATDEAHQPRVLLTPVSYGRLRPLYMSPVVSKVKNRLNLKKTYLRPAARIPTTSTPYTTTRTLSPSPRRAHSASASALLPQ
ncbi:uncharacterized protein B0H18DRAFT_991844 [Fomitopsis serialis]|uniref:uncharacterized protein n=1 Tax=Fomitopsis serialis TaxID=139415 RepID=UPI0020086CD1|nr:uncharacterized protein B0H18DRAFT_991844 [Neoantrodia serialis]KAH9930918.1 hypothetical protein B0H18DRAFT_991844 [Neoantrodia serialis]